MRWSADFETTTDPLDCRVWAVGLCSIDENKTYIYGNKIEWLIDFFKDHPGDIFYFHNLKFDGEFIYSWLLKNGFKHTRNKDLEINQFKTLINDKGQHFSIEICFDLDEKGKPKTVSIYDSLKILPFSVEEIAKAFGLPISKLSIDYEEKRGEDHMLTKEEIDYLKNDVTIVACALEQLFNENLTKMTQASNAMKNYKEIVTPKKFDIWFPTPYFDEDIRQSYKGGFTYCNPKFQGKEIREGIVLDVNSLYPSVMYYEALPYGEGKFFTGKYEHDSKYFLYIQNFKCCFQVKKDHIPTLQIKNNLSFIPTEYLESSNDEQVRLCLTSVDLDLFLDHYDIWDVEWLNGWKFRGTTGLFCKYIDKWNKIKMESTINGNKGMRTLAKLMLNSLYGKFALNPRVVSKTPYLDENGIVKYKTESPEFRKPIYIPVGCFITAYARNKTIRSAQKVYDRFCYADTDSLHLIGTEIPENLEIDPVKLGAWKHESTFSRAKFIRQKTYIEEIEGKLNITCAGMPKKCYENVTWENFEKGSVFAGKKQLTHVPGGIVLTDIDFTIKGDSL